MASHATNPSNSGLFRPLAGQLAEIAHAAGRLILKHYAADTTPARQKADFSPVTIADEEAEIFILGELAKVAPGVPVVAEESNAAGHRVEPGERFFLVDPLDGTKEFIKKNGEFTVNIALVERGIPVMGVVLAPAKARLFIGDVGRGAFELAAPEDLSLDLSTAQEIRARKAPPEGYVAVVSRSHRDTKTEEYLAHYKIASMLSAGSSLKFCLVAAGEADIYPRHGNTHEWDTAAGHAIVSAAGGSVTTLDGKPLAYGNAATNFLNPHYVARGLE